MDPWLRALRHDLVKRAVWPARDLRESGEQDLEALRRGLTRLRDAEGRPITALLLFERMRAGSPCPARACDSFAAALQTAVASLDSPWPEPLRAVLALEDAFSALERSLEK
ncbi:MAG TPA: hypothetical protein VMK66_08410 [Myxococcales bacterium]|nr:hypothetical protein [Myxococcales bacterium]